MDKSEEVLDEQGFSVLVTEQDRYYYEHCVYQVCLLTGIRHLHIRLHYFLNPFLQKLSCKIISKTDTGSSITNCI